MVRSDLDRPMAEEDVKTVFKHGAFIRFQKGEGFVVSAID